MDLFPLSVGAADSARAPSLAASTSAPAAANTTALTMGYFDGNTVTGMWNYAQHYALNDHSFGTTFGASTQGAINLISGQTNGVINQSTGSCRRHRRRRQRRLHRHRRRRPGRRHLHHQLRHLQHVRQEHRRPAQRRRRHLGLVPGRLQPRRHQLQRHHRLQAHHHLRGHRRHRARLHPAPRALPVLRQHPEPEPHPPGLGRRHRHQADTGAGTANHQYDILDFNAALAAGNLPAVSFLKAPGFQDGHAGYSDPLDEQNFIVTEINAIQTSPFWSNTAIIIAYDDSDGWYDHLTDFVNGSNTTCRRRLLQRHLRRPAPASPPAPPRYRVVCGLGPRLPLLVISPWAKANYIDSTVTDQSSITRFIEDIFLNSARIGGGSYDADAGTLNNMFNFSNAAAPPNPNNLQLNPTTGQVVSTTAPAAVTTAQ